MIETGLEDTGYEGDELKKGKEWFTDLLNYTYDEHDYIENAYKSYNDSDIDPDYIPFCKKTLVRLEIIYDAFDEICRRLKK